ncbi:MFS transporter [Phenylobacterium zucineum]|uniref:MFS transporter n=1 Tax=Phenylobacterium zucineum TaxID=284016 RepID=UPI0003036E1A|nr:MFS transporter [Phenylobacterium zucineum]
MLVLLYLLNTLDRGVLALVVDPVKADLAISDFQMSMLLGLAFALFYALCGLPIGWLVDRFPRRIILYLGVTFWSIATIACGMAQSFPQLLLARMALGVGEATLGPCAHSIIADKFPKHQMATALSIYTAGAVLGTGASMAVGGLAVAYFTQRPDLSFPFFGDLRPWQMVFVAIGLPGLILATLVFTFREPQRLHQREEVPTRLLPFLRERRAVLLGYAGSFALFSMLIYGALAWLPAYMERAFGWGPAEVGPALGLVNVLSAGIGTIGAGWLVDRLIARGHSDAHLQVFSASVLLATPVGIGAFLVDDPRVFLVCVFLLKMMAFSYIGYGAAAVQAVTPSALRGRMAAIYLLSLAIIGNAGGPSLIAFFTDFVFGDPAKLGWSIATALALLAPLALISAQLGRAPMRLAVERLRGEEASKADG